jgi:hypothetical protein
MEPPQLLQIDRALARTRLGQDDLRHTGSSADQNAIIFGMCRLQSATWHSKIGPRIASSRTLA